MRTHALAIDQMSSNHIYGNFLLVRSYRDIRAEPTDFRHGSHLYYEANCHCHRGIIPATIRVHQIAGCPAIPNRSVAFIIGRAIVNRNGEIEIEAINIFQYPRICDPRALVNSFLPRIYIVGHVIGRADRAVDGTCLFPLTSRVYIRDGMQTSTIMWV